MSAIHQQLTVLVIATPARWQMWLSHCHTHTHTPTLSAHRKLTVILPCFLFSSASSSSLLGLRLPSFPFYYFSTLHPPPLSPLPPSLPLSPSPPPLLFTSSPKIRERLFYFCFLFTRGHVRISHPHRHPIVTMRPSKKKNKSRPMKKKPQGPIHSSAALVAKPWDIDDVVYPHTSQKSLCARNVVWPSGIISRRRK
jgi:hypothetical protein